MKQNLRMNNGPQATKLFSSPSLDIYCASMNDKLERPFIIGGISAGFPSPALDFSGSSIDLSKHLIKHPDATFCAIVKGQSMEKARISDGDLLVIDKSLNPKNGDIAVCYIDGDFTLKRIKITAQKELWLLPENDNYEPIKVEEHNNFIVWGILTHSIISH